MAYYCGRLYVYVCVWCVYVCVCVCVWGWWGGGVKNTYELLNLRALKFSPVDKMVVPFEIPHKIYDPYIERYDFI